MNLVAMIGNVASDPKLSYASDGKAIASFKLAISRPGGEVADMFSVACTDRQAEVVMEYVQLGRRISVEGRVRSIEPKGIDIAAHRIQLLGARPQQINEESKNDSVSV